MDALEIKFKINTEKDIAWKMHGTIMQYFLKVIDLLICHCWHSYSSLFIGHISSVTQGPSINDVSPKGEGGGYKKCPKRRRLLVDLRRQGEGGYPKNLKFGETSFMDGPQHKLPQHYCIYLLPILFAHIDHNLQYHLLFRHLRTTPSGR